MAAFFLPKFIFIVVLTIIIGYLLSPPAAFPDRLAAIPEKATVIDNKFYNLPQFATQWWNDDGVGLAGLQLLNPARVGYFYRIFKETLGSGVVHENGRFLDVGCGGGLATEGLAKRGLSIVGIDISDKSLNNAREHAAQNNVDNVSYQVGSAYDIPFPDESFDGIVISDVLEHLHDLPRAVKEMKRVLKPNGVIVFDTLTRTWPSYISNALVQDVFHWTPPGTHDWRLFILPEELQTVFEANDFTVDLSQWRSLDPVFRLPSSFSIPALIKEFAESDKFGFVVASYLGYARKTASL